MRRFLCLVLSLAIAGPGLAAEVDLPRLPSVSPDGSRIAFSWRGDLWTVPAGGGHATRLTSHPAPDLRSAWSPDGTKIAFDSQRSGYSNLHVMNADGSDVRQVTHTDTGYVLSGFGDAGRDLLFQAYREHDVYREPRPYAVAVEGGPVRRLHDAFGRSPRVSPDRTRATFTRGGSSWNRRHYRGPAARDVWMHDRESGTFRQLTTWAGNDGLARWKDDRTLVYLSDREFDTVNVWTMDAVAGEASARRLTGFRGRDAQWLDVSADGSLAVVSAWDGIYTLDLTRELRAPQKLTITAPEDAGDRVRLQSVAGQVSEARLAPGGKVMAYVSYGEVFVRALAERSPTVRVTDTHAREKEIAWSPDGAKLYFVSDRDGTDSIYTATVALTRAEVRDAFDKATGATPPTPALPVTPPVTPPVAPPVAPPDRPAPPKPPGAEPGATAEATPEAKTEKKDKPTEADRWEGALRFDVTPVIVGPDNDRRPWPSPDGTQLAFRRGRGDLAIHDFGTGTTRVLASGWDTGLECRWSPDGRHVAYHRNDRNFNADIWIARADGSSPPVNISRHPSGDYNPRWSADGKLLAFASERRDDEFDVYMVFLDKELEGYSRLALDEYFEERASAAKKAKPLAPKKDEKGDEETAGTEEKPDGEVDGEPELDLADAYLRLRRVTKLRGSEIAHEFAPAGDTIVFQTDDGDDAGIYTVKWDGTDRKRLRGKASLQHLSLSGDKTVYVSAKRAGVMNTGGGGEKTYALSGTLEIDRAEFSAWKFREAARVIGEVFYHPTMKGLDWPAVSTRYLELARRTRTADEFDFVAARLLGELNASHLGIRTPSPPAPVRQANGRLGIDGEQLGGEFRVTAVVRDGPADKDPMRLLVGDVITAVDGARLRPDVDFEGVLRGKTGTDVVLDVRRTLDGQPRQLLLLVRPISSGADRELRYRAWTRRNAELASRWSNGSLGYIHIRSMNAPSLRDFERDLYAAAEGKQGLLVDVRNNGGGYTADLVLASIMTRAHAYTVPRGADPGVTNGYPSGRLFIQRYVMPMNMLCNEKSFSNAEIVSHAFKSLGRGQLVGQQTYGGVISTGSYQLVDGTRVRTPFRGWYLLDGTDMENNGAIPDVRVPQTPQAETRGEDPQLFAAVQDLLERVE